MGRRRTRSPTEELAESEINLTPLIDVVFVLLIMFIIVAPLLEMDRIQLANGPRHEEKTLSSAHEMSSLYIHVRKDNTILLNGKTLYIDDFRRELKRAYAKNPKIIPQLFHDKSALFGTYQEVKNAIEEAGFEELEIVLQPKK